jgi:hypothetical protein
VAPYPPAISTLVEHRSFESLSYRFVLASNDAELARRAANLIGEFAHAVDDSPPPAGSRGGSAPVIYALQSESGNDGQRSYILHRGDRQVAASPDPRLVIGQLLWQISSDTVELAEGYVLIHAGAVVTPAGDGVVILGESGSGKTTLVAALVQEGYGFLSDEAAAIELATGLAHPWPRPLGFKRGSRSLARFAPLFADGSGEESASSAKEYHVPINQIRRDAIAGPCCVRHVIDHCFKPGAPTRLESLSRPIALVRMGSAAPRLRREGDRGLALLARIIEGARAHLLVSGDLEHGVRAVRRQVER